MTGADVRTASAVASFRYDVVGYLGGTLGLAVAARNTVHALEASGRRVREIVVEPRPTRTPGRAPAHLAPADLRSLLLFHVNPLEVAGFSNQWRDAVDLRLPTACVPFWELPLVPRSWEPMLSAMQAILAPTRFVHDACARVVPGERVLRYPQAVFPPAGIAAARGDWGLAPNATVFVASFDLDSDIERKNPWAAIRAFQVAFPTAPDVQLVIKSKPRPDVETFAEQAAELRRVASRDRRIRIVDATLPYADVLRLYASCDVMVSLHRSEGLGLHLMEAMSLGKVVVATNWSGNVDFMASDNSVPVPYQLVPVAPQHPGYLSEVGREGQFWAEPDVEAAAEALRALHADASRRRTLGAAAARAMEERRGQMLSGATFDALEALLARLRGNPARFGAAMRRTRRSILLLGIRHHVRAARRAFRRWLS